MKKIYKLFFFLLILFILLKTSQLYSARPNPFFRGNYRVLRLTLELTSATNLSKFPENIPIVGHFSRGIVTLYSFFEPAGGEFLLQIGWVTLKDYHHIGRGGGWIKFPQNALNTTFYDILFYNLVLRDNYVLIGGKVTYPQWTVVIDTYAPPQYAKLKVHPLFDLFAIFNENPKSKLTKYFFYKVSISNGRVIKGEKCFHDLLVNDLIIKIDDLGILHSVDDLIVWTMKNHKDQIKLQSAIKKLISN